MLQQRQDWETPQVKDLEHVYMRLEVNSNRFEISHHFQKLFRLHGDFTLFCYEHLLFTWKTHCGLKFHFGHCFPEMSFTTPEVMWTLTMKLPRTELKFYPEVKSQTGLSSLRALWGQFTGENSHCTINLIDFVTSPSLSLWEASKIKSSKTNRWIIIATN